MGRNKKVKKKPVSAVYCSTELLAQSPGNMRGPRGIISVLTDVCLLMMAVYGILDAVAEPLSITLEMQIVLPCIAVASLVCLLMFRQKKTGKFLLPAAVIIYWAMFWSNMTQIHRGALTVYNRILEYVNYYYELNILPVPVTGPAGGNETIFLLFLMMLPLSLAAYSLSGGSRAWYVAGTAGFAALPFVLGLVPGSPGILLYLCASLAVLGCRYINKAVTAEIRIVILASAALVLFLCSFAFNEEQYQDTIRFDELKTGIWEEVGKIDLAGRFDSFFGWSLFTDKSKQATGGLSNGRIGAVSEVYFNNTPVLEITLRPVRQGSLYLKGYIGEVYRNTQWTGLDTADRDMYQEIVSKYGYGAEDFAKEWMSLYIKGNYGAYMNPPEEDLLKKLSSLNANMLKIQLLGEASEGKFFPYNMLDPMKINADGRLLPVNETKMSGDIYVTSSLLELTNILSSMLTENKPMINYAVRMLCLNTANRMALDEALGDDLVLSAPDSAVGGLLLHDFAGSDEDGASAINFGTADMTLAEAYDLISAVETYAQKENEYRNYAQAVYTRLPDMTAPRAVIDFKKEVALALGDESGQYPWNNWTHMEGGRYSDMEEPGQQKMDDLQEVLRTLQTFLTERAVYTLKPGVVPWNRDFVDYFLYENRKGYCSHFATAATVLLRAVGIPARYVEGYVVTAEDFKKGKYQEDYSLLVTIEDSSAHAWTEVYVEGYGWLPVEVTPGYMDGPSAGADNMAEALPDETEDNKEDGKPDEPDKPVAKPVKPEPEAADQPQEPQTGIGTEGAGGRGGMWDRLPPGGRAAVCMAVLSLSIVCLYAAKNYFYIKKRKNILRDASFNRVTIYYYRELERLCRRVYGLPRGTALEAYAAGSLKSLRQDGLAQCIAAAGKAAFGREEADSGDAELISQFYLEVLTDINRNNARWKVFYYKYIRIVR